MTNKLPHGEVLSLKLLDKLEDSKIFGKLVRVQGDEAFSELFKYDLKLRTENRSIMDKIKCNQEISFSMEFFARNGIKHQRLFSGTIETISFKKWHNPKESSNYQYEYDLTVVPKLASLMKVTHSRVFYKEKQEIVEVIKKVLDEHKIDYDIKIKDQGLFLAETCIQYEETDYDFIFRLIQSIGGYYYFRHEKNKHTMVIANQQSQYVELPDKLVQYVDDGGQLLHLNDFALSYTSYVADFAVNAFTYANPENVIEKLYSNISHQHQEGKILQNQFSAYLYDVQSTDQVSKLAENQSVIEQLSTEQLTGQSKYLTFSVGGKFKLGGKFFEEFQKKDYVISKLSFLAECDNEHYYINQFTSIPSNRLFISSKKTHKPVISGLHFALVVNSQGKTSDNEPCSDDKGSVYIKLLWGRENSICKANVLSTTNSYTIPRVGALVYILFPYNNLYNDKPVIVGMHNQGLLNFNDKEEFYKNIYMAYPASSDKELYNSIFFVDKKEEQKINIEARKDLLINVEHDEINVIKNDSKSTIKNIRKVVVEEGSDILEINKGDIVVEAKEGKYLLTAKGDIIIQSAGEISIDSKADLNIKSGGKINMESKHGIFIKTEGEYKSQSAKDTVIDATQGVKLNGQKIVAKAKTSAHYESGTATQIKSGTSTEITSTTALVIEGISSELKGKANLKVSSPMTKIGM